MVLNERANIGPCMDVKAHNGLLYAIKRYDKGKLFVLKPDLSVVCVIEGLGSLRQIEIINNIAVISARQDGLRIFDVSEEIPKKLAF